MILFKIGGYDYTANIVADTYSVSNKPEYTEWIDANGKKHKSKYRDRITGTFTIFFNNMSEYVAFQDVVKLHKNEELCVLCSVRCNDDNEIHENVELFMEYETVRNINGAYADYIDAFSVNIEER